MILRRAKDRGITKLDWLDAKHSFSFGHYFDPKWTSFASLRVMNEDIISEGAGFPAHSHQNMEILTLVLKGELEHKDSMGNQDIIRPFEFQKMSAGTGVYHSEFNPSKTNKTHLYQIWFLPNKQNIKPNYHKYSPNLDLKNEWIYIGGKNPNQEQVKIEQDLDIYFLNLDSESNSKNNTKVQYSNSLAWIQIIEGSVSLNKDLTFSAGDAIILDNEEKIHLEGKAKILAFQFYK